MQRRAKRKPWGAIITISLAAGVILSCFGLSVWVVYRAVDPWASSYQKIVRIEDDGARYYKKDAFTSKQYERVKEAVFAARQGHLDKALDPIRMGIESDPNNSVFYYIEAAARVKAGDIPSALKRIQAGNRTGAVRLYATVDVPANKWRWPEIDLIYQMGRAIIRDPACSKASLLSVLQMSQKLLWCYPTDIFTLIQGAELRNDTAQKLFAISKKDGDASLAKVCKALIDEGETLKQAARKSFRGRESFSAGTRAWTLARTLENKGTKFRDAAYLAILEDQAERAAKMREKNLRILDLGDLQH